MPKDPYGAFQTNQNDTELVTISRNSMSVPFFLSKTNLRLIFFFPPKLFFIQSILCTHLGHFKTHSLFSDFISNCSVHGFQD